MLLIGQPETQQELEEYFDLRWRILRAPWQQPRGSEKDEYDELADHITVRNEQGTLLGVGRLHLTDNSEAQIRYMATEANCRNVGIGKAIVERLETIAYAHGVERVVLNARDNVVGFYERLGYVVIGAGPTLFNEIRHQKMEKRLFAANAK